jgi:hypothetical protein
MWGLGTSLGVFLVGSFLPEWSIWRRVGDGRLMVGEFDANLWRAIGHGSWWRSTDGNLLSTAFLLVIATGVGLLVYWIGMGRRRPVEAADYKDAPGGAVPDGRGGSTP